MTLAEITEYIEIKIEKENEEAKWQAQLVYRQADLMCASLARLFKENINMPHISEVFPNMFEKPIVTDWRIIKEEMQIYKQRHNAQMKGRWNDDN